jgi:hypothetical protein
MAISMPTSSPLTDARGQITQPWARFLQVIEAAAMPVGDLRATGLLVVGPEWIPADGAILNIADYPELFAAYGIVYGGDGTTTFGVPDMTAVVGHWYVRAKR